jgi:serine/threonine protein kinase
MMPRGRRIGTGDVVGERFRLGEEIGEGGMGRVYEAQDMRFDRPAAVKVISRRLAQDQQFRARFQREAEAAERANHPHILPVWDYGSAGSSLYLVTPLCDSDLAAYIEDQQRLPLSMALEIIGQIAWALDWAHGRGVVHRDVKPGNILLVTGVSDVHAYLGDFGMARVASGVTLTQEGEAVGLSPAYAAPEQWAGESVSRATDQYALAGALYTCLSGHPPFDAESVTGMRFAHLMTPPPALEIPGLPNMAAVSRALQVAMAKVPAERYSSCQQLVAAVRDATASTVADVAPARERDRRPLSDEDLIPTDPEHPMGRRDAGGTRYVSRSNPTELVVPAPPPVPEVDRAAHTQVGTSVAPRRRRRPLLTGAVVLVLVAVVAAAVVVLTGGGGEAGDGLVAAQVTVGERPSDLTADGDVLWVANQGDDTISRLDATSAEPIGAALKTVDEVSQIAAGNGGVWAASADGKLQGFDAASGRAVGPILDLETTVYDMVVSGDALWIADGQGHVIQVPVNGQILAEPRPPVPIGPDVVALSANDEGDGVWAATSEGSDVTGVTAGGASVVLRSEHPGAAQVAATPGGVWVANGGEGMLMRFAASGGAAQQTLSVPGSQRAALAASGDTVLYVALDLGQGRAITGSSGVPAPLAGLAPGASAVTVAAGRAWLAYAKENTVRAYPLPQGTS